jgi:hypothetical protein
VRRVMNALPVPGILVNGYSRMIGKMKRGWVGEMESREGERGGCKGRRDSDGQRWVLSRQGLSRGEEAD